MNEQAAQTFQEGLRLQGIFLAPLSKDEVSALDRDGYVVLPRIIDPGWLEELRTAFERGCEKNVRAVIKESGTRHVDDLINRDQVFERVITHPRVLSAVHHILPDGFRAGQLGGRDPLPGYGQQGLHADWTARVKGEPFRAVTTIWLLDDFTPENGATRLVPGTHFLLGGPPKSFVDPASRHPEQKMIVADAGSVLVFNGHLWHSGTANRSDKSRRVLQCTFVMRNEFRYPRNKVADPERLSPGALYVLAASGL